MASRAPKHRHHSSTTQRVCMVDGVCAASRASSLQSVCFSPSAGVLVGAAKKARVQRCTLSSLPPLPQQRPNTLLQRVAMPAAALVCVCAHVSRAAWRTGWLEDGPHGARDHSVWQCLPLMCRLHCSEARPWWSLSGLVPKIRPKAATSASHAGRRRCRVRGPTATRRTGTPYGGEREG